MKRNEIIEEFSSIVKIGNFIKVYDLYDEKNFGNWICEYKSNKYILKIIYEKGELFIEFGDNVINKYHDLRIIYGFFKNDTTICSIVYSHIIYRNILEEILDEFSRIIDYNEYSIIWDQIDNFEHIYRTNMF